MLEILNYTIVLSIVRLSEVEAHVSSSTKIVDLDCAGFDFAQPDKR
ncbi:hypothetical protein J2Y38_000237 [Flavobacterium sp. 2755]|nr:hypothetical protein [Flavobacterium sp. 2755]